MHEPTVRPPARAVASKLAHTDITVYGNKKEMSEHRSYEIVVYAFVR
jgi:hypothetical protein